MAIVIVELCQNNHQVYAQRPSEVGNGNRKKLLKGTVLCKCYQRVREDDNCSIDDFFAPRQV